TPHPSLLPAPVRPRSTLFPYTTLFRSWSGVSSNLPPLLRKIFTTAPSPSRHTTAMSGLPSPSMSPKAAEAAPMFHAATTTFFCEIGKHTSELQSLRHLVCRLLLEKKKL